MKPIPVFHLLAGPNGAGKSTLYRALVGDRIIDGELTFINADLFERDHLQHIADPEQRSATAREWAETQRASKLLIGESFVSETVFSHASKLALIEEAVAYGYGGHLPERAGNQVCGTAAAVGRTNVGWKRNQLISPAR